MKKQEQKELVEQERKHKRVKQAVLKHVIQNISAELESDEYTDDMLYAHIEQLLNYYYQELRDLDICDDIDSIELKAAEYDVDLDSIEDCTTLTDEAARELQFINELEVLTDEFIKLLTFTFDDIDEKYYARYNELVQEAFDIIQEVATI